MRSCKVKLWLALAAAGLAQACAPAGDDSEAEQELVARSSALADQFQADLKQELSTSLAKGGPVAAISVCQSAAPAIAQSLSQEGGAQVRRVARRNRNPGGALPDDLERLYSQLEESPMKEGAPRAVHTMQGDRFTYMRAIPMQEQPCAACHGTELDPAIEAAIARAYPMDRAIGFEPGELRGAFVIQLPRQN